MWLKVLLFLSLIIAPFTAFSAITVDKSILEEVSDKISLQVLTTNSAIVTVTIDIDSPNTRYVQEFISSTAYKAGYKLSSHSTPFFTRFVLTFDKAEITPFLKTLETLLVSSQLKTSYLKILVLGDIPEQKIVGELFRVLKNVEELSVDQATSKGVLKRHIDSYRKDPSKTFAQLLAVLLACSDKGIKDIDFVVVEETIKCVSADNLRNLNQGEIANIVLSYRNHLIRKLREPERYIALLANISVDDNIHFVEIFIDYLSNISIEQISNYYQELVSESQQAVITDVAITDDHITTHNNDGLKTFSLPEQPLGLALVFDSYFNLCSFYDCDALHDLLEIQFINSYPAMIKVDYEQSFSSRSHELVLGNIIRPLLLAGYHSKDLTLIKLGWSDNDINFDYQSIGNLLSHQNSFASRVSDKVCFESLDLNNRGWIQEKLLIYGALHFLNNNEFKLLEHNCLLSNNEVSTKDIIERYQAELTSDEFLFLKQAMLNRLKVLDASPIYPLFKEVYGYDIIEFHTQILSNLEYSELKAF